MRSFRHLGLLLCLAFAFAIGQQGALLHALGHATEQVQHKGDGKPGKLSCDTCATLAQPSGMPGAGMPPVATPERGVASWAFALRSAPARSILVFRSRAPPVLL